MEAVHTMKGVQGTLEVFQDRIAITPKGILAFLNHGLKGKKEIPYTSIVAIQFKEATALFSGYLQFTIPGGNEDRGGLLSATKDENSFMFAHKKNNAQATEIKEFIDSAISELHKPQLAPTKSLADELQKLASMMQQGVLSEEEFQTAKAKLLES